MMINDLSLSNLIWALNVDLTFKLIWMDIDHRGDTDMSIDESSQSRKAH